MAEKYLHEELTEQVIGCSFKVHKELGAGFLEKVYQNALAVELRELGINFEQEYPLSVHYRGYLVGEYIPDFIIDGKVIVELKAVSSLSDPHEVQLVNYLKATGLRVGLLINFGKSVAVKRRIL
jgi:GxxExxY protein